jgi:hypothetical protein
MTGAGVRALASWLHSKFYPLWLVNWVALRLYRQTLVTSACMKSGLLALGTALA